MSKTYQEQEIEDNLDQISDLALGWDECLNMVANATETKDRELLLGYTRELLTRLKQLERRFNRVKAIEGGYVVENYSFDMYVWARKKGLDSSLITPNRIVLPPLVLTAKEREQFNQQRES